MSRHSRRKKFATAVRPSVTTPASTTFPIQNHAATPSTQLQRVIVWLFHLLVLTVPFFFTWINEELFEFNKMMLTYGLTALMAAAWGSRMLLEKRFIFQRTWLDLPILIFALSQLLATIFSIHPHTSVFGYYTRFHGGFLSTLTYITLYYAFVSNLKKSDLPNFLLTTLAAAVGVTLYAIPEHYGASPSCALISGEWNVACWVQDVKSRVFATFGQPNWLAAYTITLLPVSVALTLKDLSTSTSPTTQTTRRVFYAVASCLLLTTLLFTQSRSGFLGFGASMMLFAAGWAWVQTRKPRWSEVTKPLLTFLAIITSFSLLIAVFGSPWSPPVSHWWQRSVVKSAPVEVTSPEAPTSVNRLDIGGTDSGEIRKIVWQGAVDVWRRYPLFGSGVETFAYSYYQDRPMAHNLVSEWDFLYNKAHNELLNFLATTGIVGLSAYLILYTALLLYSALVMMRSQDETTMLLALGVGCGLVALFISNFFGFSTVMVTILMFLYPALLVVQSQRSPAVATSTASTSFRYWSDLGAPQWLGLSGIGLATLYLLFSLGAFWQADKMYSYGKQLDNAGYSLEAVQYLTSAVMAAPNEAVYYDELSNAYSKVAVALAQQGEATQAAQVAQAAILNSDQAMLLNERHLNFYKTRTRVFITLAQLNPQFLAEAEKTLLRAIELSPTEAKLYYNLGVVEISMGKTDQGMATLQKTIQMKPDYEAARYALGQQYELKSDFPKAIEQYQYILDNINPNNQVVREAIKTLTADPKDLI